VNVTVELLKETQKLFSHFISTNFSIYSPSCCSKPLWVSFFCWTQNMIFLRVLVSDSWLLCF